MSDSSNGLDSASQNGAADMAANGQVDGATSETNEAGVVAKDADGSAKAAERSDKAADFIEWWTSPEFEECLETLQTTHRKRDGESEEDFEKRMLAAFEEDEEREHERYDLYVEIGKRKAAEQSAEQEECNRYQRSQDNSAETDASSDEAEERLALLNPSDTQTYYSLLFKHASGGHVMIRSFRERETDPGRKVFNTRWIPAGETDAFMAAVEKQNNISATREPLNVCTATCTFGKLQNVSGKRLASEANAVQGLAILVELDGNVSEAGTKLRQLLGAPTLRVFSGGVDENGHDKEHWYYVLSVPAAGRDEIKMLKDVRDALSTYVGGDSSSDPVVHPIRMPGGLHQKGAPRACRIAEVSKDAEVDLQFVRQKLESKGLFEPTKKERRSRREALDEVSAAMDIIATGSDGLHEAINKVSASLFVRGLGEDEIRTIIEGQMHKNGMEGDPRWEERFDDIERAISSAISKFENEDHFLDEEVRREKISIYRDKEKRDALLEKVKPAIDALEEGQLSKAQTIIDDMALLRLSALEAEELLENINQKVKPSHDGRRSHYSKLDKAYKEAVVEIERLISQRRVEDGNDSRSKALEKYNEDYAAVAAGQDIRIVRLPKKTTDRFELLKTHAFVGLEVPNKIEIVSPDGVRELFDPARHWLTWQKRKTYNGGLVFEPSGECADNALNMWRGFSVKGVEGDWSLLRGHIFKMLCHEDPYWFAYIMLWLADLVQNPGGDKHGVAVVVRGKKGTGKSKVSDWIFKLAPHHSIVADKSKTVLGDFNAHMADCLFMVMEEPFWAGDKKADSTFKHLITGGQIFLERKGIDGGMVSNHMRFWLNSNSDWVVPASMASEERRFFVLECKDDHRLDIPYFRSIDEQMKDGGLEAMMYDLQNLNQPDWIELREAPKTKWLKKQADHSQGAEDQWLHYCVDNGGIDSTDADYLLDNGWQSDGSFSEDEATQFQIERVYASYVEFLKGTRWSKKLPEGFGHWLLGRGLGIEKIRPRTKKVRRPRMYKFPSLVELQAALDKESQGGYRPKLSEDDCAAWSAYGDGGGRPE